MANPYAHAAAVPKGSIDVVTLEYGGFPTPVKKGSYNKKKGKYEKLSAGGWSKQTDPGGWGRVALMKAVQKIKTL